MEDGEMKRVDLTAYGTPQGVASCVEVPDVGVPGPDEVVFDVLAFPINPADVSFCRGSYRLRPPLPATPGAECVGRVSVVGTSVTQVRPCDLVVNMQRENWVQRRRIRSGDAIPVPAGLDLAQAAMLRINPATALLLLADHVDLKPGDWVIQDVANSAVGRHLIVLAKARGVRTVNVVRRDGVAAELSDLVADGGVVVSYGSMSGEDPAIGRAALNMRGVSLTGFNLGRGLAKRSPAQVRKIYADLASKIRDGVLKAPIDSFYPIEDIKPALVRAQQGGRSGKVLVLSNGPL